MKGKQGFGNEERDGVELFWTPTHWALSHFMFGIRPPHIMLGCKHRMWSSCGTVTSLGDQHSTPPCPICITESCSSLPSDDCHLSIIKISGVCGRAHCGSRIFRGVGLDWWCATLVLTLCTCVWSQAEAIEEQQLKRKQSGSSSWSGHNQEAAAEADAIRKHQLKRARLLVILFMYLSICNLQIFFFFHSCGQQCNWSTSISLLSGSGEDQQKNKLVVIKPITICDLTGTGTAAAWGLKKLKVWTTCWLWLVYKWTEWCKRILECKTPNLS